MNQKQIEYCEWRLANPGYPAHVYAEQLHLNKSTIYRWNHDPEVSKYLEERTKEIWKDAIEVAVECMVNAAREGGTSGVSAAKYILDSNGFSAPKQIKVDADMKVNSISVGFDNE